MSPLLSASVVAGMMGKFKRAFQSRLEGAQQAGALDARTHLTARTRYLVNSTQGLCVTAKGGASREDLLDSVEVTLSTFR